ncbi:hypothetical protein ACVILI_006911 [Mesorhizobium sp. USDA 4775]|uniref:Uncharacterized protein n=1 Tax=Mesorhizobium qingshengii TaxID=1165689 RepID=A0A1G5ZZW2_9HYPH|nr:hypothetical protein SAMN02927914_06844 [Mesorhizobium qingshengii]
MNPGQDGTSDDPAPNPTQWLEDLTGAQGTEAWMQHYYLLQQQQQAGQPAVPQQAAAERPLTRGRPLRYIVSDEDEALIKAAAGAAVASGMRPRLSQTYCSSLRALSEALRPLGLSLAGLDGDSLRQYAKEVLPHASQAVGMLERYRQESSGAGEGSSRPQVDRRRTHIVSDEDEGLIKAAAGAAVARGAGPRRVHTNCSSLRALSEALRPSGLSLAGLDSISLRQYARELLPQGGTQAVGMLERYWQESSGAGEGSSRPQVDQAAPSPLSTVDQDEVWAAMDAADQPAPSPQSFNSAEFWAGVDQAGQLPADSFNTANFWQGMPSSAYSPAQSVNQPSPPTWDQDLGASIFGHQPAPFDFGEYVPPNWEDGFQAPIDMLRQMHYRGLLPSQSQQMITIYIRGQSCTAVLGPRGQSNILLYRQ